MTRHQLAAGAALGLGGFLTFVLLLLMLRNPAATSQGALGLD